jgi:hypothetical protein
MVMVMVLVKVMVKVLVKVMVKVMVKDKFIKFQEHIQVKVLLTLNKHNSLLVKPQLQ